MDIFKNLYYGEKQDPKPPPAIEHAAFLGSIAKLNTAINSKSNSLRSSGSISNIVQAKKKRTNLKKTREWLSTQNAYSLHRPVIRKFQRNPYRVFNIVQLWELDLVDMSTLHKHNDGCKYLLTVIDVFSKYCWVRPLKSKSSTEVTKAFSNIIQSAAGRKPVTAQSDRGREFNSANFKAYLDANNIKQRFPHTFSLNKAAVVERVQKTLQQQIYKYFTWMDSSSENKSLPLYKRRRYIDILPLIVDTYNKSPHRTIKMRPIDVNEKNIAQVYENTMRQHQPPLPSTIYSQNNNLSENDVVRIARKKTATTTFIQGYKNQWSDEKFYIKKRIERKPYAMYILSDFNDREITNGRFYGYELQKIFEPRPPPPPVKNKIILKTRGLGSNLEYFVKDTTQSTTTNGKWVSAKNYNQ